MNFDEAEEFLKSQPVGVVLVSALPKHTKGMWSASVHIKREDGWENTKSHRPGWKLHSDHAVAGIIAEPQDRFDVAFIWSVS